jgi:hypothetical protein
MWMNYQREFAGKEPYQDKQGMLEKDTFMNPNTRQLFCDAWRVAYNTYTEDFNKANNRADQEFALDQRHRFLMLCVHKQRNEKKEMTCAS